MKDLSDSVNRLLDIQNHRPQRYTFANTLNKAFIVSKACNDHYQCKNVGLTAESIRVSTVVTCFL